MAEENNLSLDIIGSPVQRGDEARFIARGLSHDSAWTYAWRVFHADSPHVKRGVLTNADHEVQGRRVTSRSKVVDWRADTEPGVLTVEVTATKKDARTHPLTACEAIVVKTAPLAKDDLIRAALETNPDRGPIEVSLQRSEVVPTDDQPLWSVIRSTTDKLAFTRYAAWMDSIFHTGEDGKRELARYVRTSLPFPNAISYKALKLATEAFLMANVGVSLGTGVRQFDDLVSEIQAPPLDKKRFDRLSSEELDERLGFERPALLKELWNRYVVETPTGEFESIGNGHRPGFIETLPYLALVRQKLPEYRVEFSADAEEEINLWNAIMGRKLSSPCFVELIWSFWQEQGMLVQTMDAISARFQNRSAGYQDPLINFATDPLRPLNNLLWGYVGDEQFRLGLRRRAQEYEHEYGLSVIGSAARPQSPDPRSKFVEAFHTLLHRASIFYKQDDDTTTIADAFPVLTALRDVHLLLAEGADNQYGDLPWTARQEMLIQQWLLARPEMRDFLPTRIMVAYPEPWMDRVDAMKRLQGWTDTSVRYFRDLAVFGEQILLSVRFGNWSVTVDRERAGNWARYWRQEVQWYILAYQTVTGVDLSADTADVRRAQVAPERFVQPSFLLRRRTRDQRRQARVGARQPANQPRGTYGLDGGQAAGQRTELPVQQ